MAQSTVSSVIPIANAVSITAGSYSTVSWNGQSVLNMYVENLDATNDAFINWTVDTGAVSAVAPTAGNPQPGVAIQNNQGRIIQIAGGNAATVANVAVVGFSGSPQVIITPVA